MHMEQGSLSINSENIFPIIKKWLYSDHDIFFRELISNGCDAITKLKKLEMIGEYVLPEDNEFKIKVMVNSEEKTVTFIDNGIGMTADEVKEYINQIAFSGAADFLEKYKDKTNEDQIIGHFGLGFYSAFMVAHKVTIDTLSWQEGASAVHWVSEEGTDFTMSEGDKEDRGTTITLYLNEDSYEFSNEYRAKEIIEKYCSFMPIPIYFKNENASEDETNEADDIDDTSDIDDISDIDDNIIDEDDSKIIDANVDEDGKAVEEDKEKVKKGPKPLNETTPLWTKHPNDCNEEQYKEFYRKVFHDYKEPLFWIHLNMDYPFNLKGILYFPKINTEYDSIEGKIKLYCNQVFIADNIKEVIPEFLLLLKGVIDCPDLPLNVSRSALQNDGFVKKISDYITKKVADKLSGMYKVERENYEKFWDDISPFIKFGCLKEDKFRDKMKDFIIFKNLDNKYITLPEYIKAIEGTDISDVSEENKTDEVKSEEDKVSADENVQDAENLDDVKEEKSEDLKAIKKKEKKRKKKAKKAKDGKDGDNEEEDKEVVYYVTDEKQQSQYINMFKEEGIDALILTHNIDQPFITQLERDNNKVKFQRIDADLTDNFKEELSEDEEKHQKKTEDELSKLFKKVLNKDKLEVKVVKIKNDKVSAMVTLSEENRRMQDMMRMYSMNGMGMDSDMFGTQETLVLNSKHPLVKYVLENKKGDKTPMICMQLYDLALISHKPLEPEAMTKFVERSNEIMMLLAK